MFVYMLPSSSESVVNCSSYTVDYGEGEQKNLLQISFIFKYLNAFRYPNISPNIRTSISITYLLTILPRDTRYISQTVYQKLSAFTFFRIQFTLHASIIHPGTSELLGHFALLLRYSVWFVNGDPDQSRNMSRVNFPLSIRKDQR